MQSVTIHYLVAQGTVDEQMWAVLQRKVRTLGTALDGMGRQRLAVENEIQRDAAADGDCDGDEAAGGRSFGGEAGGSQCDGGAGGEGQASVGTPAGCGGSAAADAAIDEEALSLLARKAERDRQLKRARERESFHALFAGARTQQQRPPQQRAPPAPTNGATPPAAGGHGASAAQFERRVAPRLGGDIATASQDASVTTSQDASASPVPAPVVDLTADDDDDGAGAIRSRPINGANDEAEGSANGSLGAAMGVSHAAQIMRAWFAVSSLTGRVHCFGAGDAPIGAGLGASAPPHAILDDEVSCLPATLGEPAMRAAAQRWASEYESLTPAQQAALADKAARVPLVLAASTARPLPPHRLPWPTAAERRAHFPSSAPQQLAGATPPSSAPYSRTAVHQSAAAAPLPGVCSLPTTHSEASARTLSAPDAPFGSQPRASTTPPAALHPPAMASQPSPIRDASTPTCASPAAAPCPPSLTSEERTRIECHRLDALKRRALRSQQLHPSPLITQIATDAFARGVAASPAPGTFAAGFAASPALTRAPLPAPVPPPPFVPPTRAHRDGPGATQGGHTYPSAGPARPVADASHGSMCAGTAPSTGTAAVTGCHEAAAVANAAGQASAAGGSTLRETTAERWASLHVPSTPHYTIVWFTSALVRCRREFVQHFCAHSQLPHCLYCLELHTPTPDSPFCSEACAASFYAASSQRSARRQLFDRELGVCQLCHFDAVRPFLFGPRTSRQQERLQEA